MITLIRRSFKSKIYKVILWITILALAGIFSLPEILKMGSKAAWIAKVNKESVSYADYVRKMALFQEQLSAYRERYGQAADMLLQAMGISLDPKEYALHAVIQESLIEQEARKIGVQISADYIAQKMANPLFVQQELSDLVPMAVLDQYGSINMPLLKAYLQRLGSSIADFDRNVEQVLQRHFVLQAVGLAVQVPEFALKHHFIQNHSVKKFSVLTIPFDQALKQVKNNAVDAQELKAYFDKSNESTKKYWVPEKRSALVWRFDPKSYGVAVSEADIENYYENHKAKEFVSDPSKIQVRHILFKATTDIERASALAKARQVREELLKDPKSFAEKAKQYSDDAATKDKGGTLPFFARGEKELAFDKAAFTLKENGSISDVIYTKDGYEIVQRVEKTPAAYKGLSAVKQEIIDRLITQKFGDIFIREMRGVIESTKGNDTQFHEALLKKGGKKESIENVLRDNKEWGQMLFGLQRKGESDVFIDKTIGVVVQLTRIAERHLPSLESIESVVKNDLYEEQAQHKIKALAKQARTLAATKSLNEVKNSVGGTVETLEPISKGNSEKEAALRKKGLPVEQMFQLEKPGAIASYESDKSAYVVRLDEVGAFDEQAYKTKKEEVAAQAQQASIRLWVQGFVASLYRTATIEVNESPNNEEPEAMTFEE